MPNGMRKIAILLCIALLCTGCGARQSSVADTQAMSSLRASYRSAQLIAAGVCTRMYYGKDQQVYSDFRITEVLAGTGAPGDVIVCETESMTLEASYLGYFSFADGDAAAQSPASLLALCAMQPDSDLLTYQNSTLSLSAIREDIALLQNVVIAPPDTWYYKDMQQLMDACDAVFIGRINDVPALSDMEFREESGSATVEHTMPGCIVPVSVFGVFKGALSYGQTASFLHVPAHASDIIDAATLTSISVDQAALPTLQTGDYGLFFLVRGPDAKQESYFCVNPLQGYVPLQEDILLASADNEAFSGCATLLDFVRNLQKSP